MPRKSRNTGNILNAQKTVDDWAKQTAQSLRLTCNSLSLVETGNKLALCRRLHAYYHPPTTQTSQEQEIPPTAPTTTNDTLRQEVIELRNLVHQLRAESQTGEGTQQQQQTAAISRGVPANIPNTPANIPTTPTNIPDAFANITAADSTLFNIPDINTANPADINPLISDQNTGIPQYGNVVPIFTHTPVEATQGMSNFISPNPYAPPAIDHKILKQIENNEYVDLALLLPIISHTTSTTDEQYLGYSADTNSLVVKSITPKRNIKTLADWFYAWNLFVQATLSIKPQLQHNLFIYQKTFSYLARRYTFDACYAYDVAHRKQLSSQLRTPQAIRTIFWEKLDEELHAIFLREYVLPACFHCKEIGHFANACPNKGPNHTINNNSPIYRQNMGSFRLHSSTSTSSSTNANHPVNIPTHPPSNTQQTTRHENTPICYRFNNTGRCNKPPCIFQHICRKCHSSSHPDFKCYSVTGSSFRP